jgi:hypothetical protein
MLLCGTSNIYLRPTRVSCTICPATSDIGIHAQGDHAEELIVTLDSSVTEIEQLAVDPIVPQRLFLLVRQKKVDLWPPARGKNSRFYMAVMISENGGGHWELLDKLRFDLDHIFIDPTSPVDNRTIYVSGKDGLGVKQNGVWSKVNVPYKAEPFLQFVDGVDTSTNRHIIYAMSGTFPYGAEDRRNVSRIYKTDRGPKLERVVQDCNKKIKYS